MDLPDPNDLATAIDKAWRRLCRALDQDHSVDAVRWLRVHAMLTALLAPGPSAPPPPRVTPETPPASTRVEKVESFFADSPSPAPQTAQTLDTGPLHATGPPPPRRQAALSP